MSTYTKYKNKAYSLRIPNEMQNKIKIIADREKRKASQQYELIIGAWLEEYEKIHGKIILSEEDQEQKQ